ncbi:hypothetical protein TRVL_06550 [Trypanosoma vivax]|nr:hypothetical protein TRVL_06550 [Trypanosoma vivax]
MSRVTACPFTLSALSRRPLRGCMVITSSCSMVPSLSTVCAVAVLNSLVSRATKSVHSVFLAGTSMQHSTAQYVKHVLLCSPRGRLTRGPAPVHTIASLSTKNTFFSQEEQLSFMFGESTTTMNGSGPSTHPQRAPQARRIYSSTVLFTVTTAARPFRKSACMTTKFFSTAKDSGPLTVQP